jgi:hypothetical protein
MEITEAQRVADWEYAKEENMLHITGDFLKYKPEAARLAVHLAMGST